MNVFIHSRRRRDHRPLRFTTKNTAAPAAATVMHVTATVESFCFASSCVQNPIFSFFTRERG